MKHKGYKTGQSATSHGPKVVYVAALAVILGMWLGLSADCFMVQIWGIDY